MVDMFVLLSDPDAELSNWPLELVALREKIHGDVARVQTDKELSSLRDDVSAGEADKWRQRRNNSFDQNRQLEEVTKERDALQRLAGALQHAVSQLVAYCASAEDELNRTVLAHLLPTLQAQQSFCEESRASLNCSVELDSSLVSRGRHVHFAPELQSILAALDEQGAAGFLQEQRDLSADIKRELEYALLRLRHEAHELLDLSARLANKGQPQTNMLESSQVEITELEQDSDTKQKPCDNCELLKKTMEETTAECLQRENLLRSDLDDAMMKIAQLMTDRGDSTDVIVEGYGTCGATVRRTGCRSLDEVSPRSQMNALARDLELLQRDRDDLHQQLEAANRQLRSTRQFVEEQAGERELERDEFARRLQDLRDENVRLTARLQSSARILSEVEQLEAQTREMNQIITDLETRKAAKDEELKSSEEKITLLRDIIASLEGQLEQKVKREAEIIEQLESMKKTIDERDSKMRALLGELESLRSEKADQTEVTICENCAQEESKYKELLEKVQEQCGWLTAEVEGRRRALQAAHELADTSSHSEELSLRDCRHAPLQDEELEKMESVEWLCPVVEVREALRALARAEDAALKRLADLRVQRDRLSRVAQEVRLERDVVQARMSEQALRVSSLSAQLARQRHAADALAHAAASDLGVQLHDATAEVQRLKEELESKDKQLARLKQNLEEKSKSEELQLDAHGDASRVEEKVKVVERSLISAQQRCAQLQTQLEALAADNKQLRAALQQRDRQLQDLMALKLEDDDQNQKSELADGKASGRTLSDIVSISEFDEQDLQMRRAELKGQNISLTGAPYVTATRDKSQLNRTLPLDLQRPNMSLLNLDGGEHFDATNFTPRADSLPIHLTSTQNREGEYKRNTNETTVFGKAERFADNERHSPQNIPDNCSLYPNRDISDSKNVSVEPKKINFSLEASDNKTQDEDFTSLRELGISLDMKQENFPDILAQLKHELKKTRNELESCKSELKNAEEQLCEFPALKEEVEELKGLLENTMATMKNDKKFYENQLENFSSNKKLLEQRLAEMTQEISDKTKDLHLLKEDILRRENMILELAKEKRNLTNKLTELEVKIDELQSRNETLEKFETETHQLKEKIKEMQKLEQLVTEKNQQIDSLNQHLDRLDDLQRCLNDKTEEYDNLKEAFHEKSNELYQLQGTVDALNRDMNRIREENNELKNYNKELNLKLSKLEKEQENASLRLQNSENELERVNSMNRELTSKIEELKTLNEKLKDKETEIEILNEDINSYHNEIASLKEQLQMVSRSPSPRSKNGEDRKTPDRQASNDRKQLAKIRKQISLLQHELDFNKKELNDKAFELAKAKLDVTELRNNASQATKQVSDKEVVNKELMKQTEALKQEIRQLVEEKQQLSEQLDNVVARLREESNVSEIKAKLREKAESCHELEMQLHEMRDMVDRREAARSPTAELERALRDQLHYSHALDDHIMDQILSASSDEREDIPRLALNTSKSSSSIHSTSSDRVGRLRAENEKLRMQVENLESRLKDKDALITELNRIRDKLVQDWQTVKLRYEAERDNSGRLQLLLDSQKETSESLQNQDSNMIQILKKRLESAMQSELELQEREQRLRRRVAELESALPVNGARESLRPEMENVERLKGEISVLRSKLEAERGRNGETQLQLQVLRLQLDQRTQCAAQLRAELADIKRLKHDAGVELARTKELLSIQSATIAELEKKLSSVTSKKQTLNDTMGSVDQHTSLASPRPPGFGAPDDKNQALRYLHGRCVRLESWRKALVWQKRYLQRVLAGYARLDRALQPPRSPQPAARLFKCVGMAVVAVVRMRFLVRRREHTRRAAALLCTDLNHDNNFTNLTNTGLAVSRNDITTPLACPRQLLGGGVRRLRPAHTPQTSSPTPTPRTPHTPKTLYAPHTPLTKPSPLTPITAFASRAVGDDVRQTLCDVNSPRNEFFLRSPRGEIASVYLDKLDAVSRCLGGALDSPRQPHTPHLPPHSPRDVP